MRRLAMDPDSHPRLEADRIGLRIESQAQCVAIVIANRALGLPSRERSERHELGDECRGWRARARPRDLDFRAHREAVQQVFARVEGQPLLAGRLDYEHRLASLDVLAELGDDNRDNAVGRRPQNGLVEPPLQHCERGRR